MQNKPEEVESQSERLRQNDHAKPSQEAAEQEEHVQAAHEEKSTASSGSPQGQDCHQSEFVRSMPAAYQPRSPQSTIQDGPLRPPPSVSRTPLAPEQAVTREGYPAGEKPLPRPTTSGQPVGQLPSTSPKPLTTGKQVVGEGLASGKEPPARQPTLPRPTTSGQPYPQSPSIPSKPLLSGQPDSRMEPPAGKEPQSRPPTWPRRALTDQPRDKNNAMGEGLQHLDSNQVGHSGMSQKKLPFSGSADLVQGQNRSQPHANAPAISKEGRQDDKAKIIMVVDDSQTVRNIMALILHRAGYRSVRVASAMEALHTLRELIPDLIFLDITLPGMDGLDVCKIIKENPRTKQVPVIMLSGNNEVFDKVMGRLAGASDYITKPFEPEIILNCIRSFLGQKKSLREGLWQGTR